MLSLPHLFCGRMPNRSCGSSTCEGALLFLWKARPSIEIQPTGFLTFLHFILQFPALFCCYLSLIYKMKFVGKKEKFYGIKGDVCCRPPGNLWLFAVGVKPLGKNRVVDTDPALSHKVSLSSYQPGCEFLFPLLFTSLYHHCHRCF